MLGGVDARPAPGGDEPKIEELADGYCMVYVPLTLEEITGGKYAVYTDPSTGVDAVIADSTYENASIYDLSGRKVNNITKSGIYIIGDKKIVVEKSPF